MEHFIVVIANQRKFESVFRWVDGDRARSCRTVQAMYCLPLDASQVDGIVKRADYAMVTTDQRLESKAYKGFGNYKQHIALTLAVDNI